MHVCMRMCVCACVYVYVYVCICVCMHVYVCVCMHVCVAVCDAHTKHQLVHIHAPFGHLRPNQCVREISGYR